MKDFWVAERTRHAAELELTKEASHEALEATQLQTKMYKERFLTER
jgi:hypothetical protein